MKTSGILIVVIGIALLAACSFGRPHTVIVENSNDQYLRIEYAGKIAFNSDGTAIASISPDGYVEYQNNNRKLEAKNNGHGGVSYELYEGYTKLKVDDTGREFIAEAVKIMKQKGHNLGN